MDIKKMALAIVVAYAVLQGTEFLIHVIWLAPVYAALDAWRAAPQMEAKMWIMWVGSFLMTVMFTYIYVRGMENKPWLEQGIRFGIVIALFAAIPFTLNNYVLYRVPYTLAIKWMIAGSLQAILMGVIVAFFFRKTA
jgi:hypothetical protein